MTMLPSPELLRRWLELSPRFILRVTLSGLAAQWRHLGYIRYLVPERKLGNDDCQGTDICGLVCPNPVGKLPVNAAGRNKEPKPLISPLFWKSYLKGAETLVFVSCLSSRLWSIFFPLTDR